MAYTRLSNHLADQLHTQECRQRAPFPARCCPYEPGYGCCCRYGHGDGCCYHISIMGYGCRPLPRSLCAQASHSGSSATAYWPLHNQHAAVAAMVKHTRAVILWAFQLLLDLLWRSWTSYMQVCLTAFNTDKHDTFHCKHSTCMCVSLSVVAGSYREC